MVLVVIKAANGAVDDFRVNGAESEWTVAELKNYLYRHYPTHPPVPCQKLIYRGQLLRNTQQLSDVARDSEKVVIHLVAYERSASAPAVRTGVPRSVPRASSVNDSNLGEGRERERREEGERGEPVTAPTLSPDTTTGQGRQPQSVAATPPGHTPHPGLRYRPHPQHMQWFPGGPAPLAFPVGGAYPYPPFYMPHMAPPYAAGFGPAHQLQQWYQAYYGRPGAVGGAGGGAGGEVGGGGEGEEIDLPNIPEQAENPDLEQDDLPMNAGAAGGMMLAGPQLPARRDLVDYSYMMLMATVLVSIAYFTSSFGRIILFLAGVLFMFLNQAGFFSLQRRPRNAALPGLAARGPDDLPDPLDRHRARQEAEEEGEREGEREGTLAGAGVTPQGDQGDDTPDGTGGSSDSAPPAPPTPPRPGILTVVFTFVTTLFTSLLPQQQPEL